MRSRLYFLVRHAESEDNAGVPGAGFDSPLTERGERQAADLKRWFAGKEVDRILSSPYRRALQTAQSIREASRAHCEVWPALGEHQIDMGEPLDKALLPFAGWTEAFPAFAPRDGVPRPELQPSFESHIQVFERALGCWEHIESTSTKGSSVTVVVSHGPFLAKFVLAFLAPEDPPAALIRHDNTHITVLERRGEGRIIHAMNAPPR